MTEGESGGKLVNKFVKGVGERGRKQLWRKRGLQFVKDGVPYCWELKSTVQIHGGTSLPNEDGFCSPCLFHALIILYLYTEATNTCLILTLTFLNEGLSY